MGLMRHDIEDARRHSDPPDGVDRPTTIRLNPELARTIGTGGQPPVRASTCQEREVLSNDNGYQQLGSEQPYCSKKVPQPHT